MSPSRILLVLRKDLQLGPRSPIFLWVLLLSAALLTVALYRPARGWWVWWLWTLGELS